MKPDRGAVLINALVLVLVISAIAAALLTRAESARFRSEAVRDGAQLTLYLDGAEALLPSVLRAPLKDGTVHRGQAWARQAFDYEIDRGNVTLQITDLQSGLNVNWLVQPDDYARESFSRLFSELRVPVTLVAAIEDYLQPGGSSRVEVYRTRNPPIFPRGGAMSILPQLRDVDGMTQAYFRVLEPHIAALPVDTRLNLNTASKQVLRAALAPFPPELVAEILARGANEPLNGLGEFRRRLFEILETEEIEGYPVERLSSGSDWFGARLTARLDGMTRVRHVVLQRRVAPENNLELVHRWAELD